VKTRKGGREKREREEERKGGREKGREKTDSVSEIEEKEDEI
jgi:hypothetical protein